MPETYTKLNEVFPPYTQHYYLHCLTLYTYIFYLHIYLHYYELKKQSNIKHYYTINNALPFNQPRGALNYKISPGVGLLFTLCSVTKKKKTR